MTICMSEIICVTNRHLCNDDFLKRIEKICKCRPSSIILREKDMSEDDYTALAAEVINICRSYDVPCTLHSFVNAAIKLKADRIHLPLHILRTLGSEDKRHFSVIGASCHSVEEAEEAISLGAGYITAGHIFDTDCKAGLPGRGLDFLRNVCEHSSVPVYAIGGISPGNIDDVINAGADGVCIMSGFMTMDL